MDEKKCNLSFSLQEVSKENQEEVTYADLLKEVDYMEMCSTVAMDDYIAQEVEYDTNYTKKELDKIAEYYEISKRKKKKHDLIEDIVVFEKHAANIETVYKRKNCGDIFKRLRPISI